jgi:hypothetical protein
MGSFGSRLGRLEPRRAALFVFALAVAMRVVYFVPVAVRNPDGFWSHDSHGYWTLGTNLIERHVFSQESTAPFEPDHSRTPAYPLFLGALAAFGLTPPMIVVVQLFVAAATCVLTTRLARRLVPSDTTAVLAGLVVALDVPSIVFANTLLTETLFTFLVVAAAFVLSRERVRPRDAAIAGLLAGSAVLCRPIGVGLPLLGASYLFFRLGRARGGERPSGRGRFLLPSVHLALAALVLFPWVLRNQLVFGSPFISTIGLRNLIETRAAAVEARAEGIGMSAAVERLEARVRERTSVDPHAEPIAYKRAQAKVALETIRDHPFVYARNHVQSVVHMLFAPLRAHLDLQLGLKAQGSSIFWQSPDGEPPSADGIGAPARAEPDGVLARLRASTSGPVLVIVAVQIAGLLLVAALAVLGLWRLAGAGRWRAVAVTLGALIYFCLVSGGPEAYARFRVPVVPFVAILAGAGVGRRMRKL